MLLLVLIKLNLNKILIRSPTRSSSIQLNVFVELKKLRTNVDAKMEW